MHSAVAMADCAFVPVEVDGTAVEGEEGKGTAAEADLEEAS